MHRAFLSAWQAVQRTDENMSNLMEVTEIWRRERESVDGWRQVEERA